MSHAILTLLRHGESEWNRSGRFTGWTDVDLSPAGVVEAERAGRLLRQAGYTFDCCFTSVLRRASGTAEIVVRTMGLEHLRIEQTWRLNERHYGALQGLRLWEAVRRYGLGSVLRCQREFSSPPPSLDPSDPRFPGHDPLYAALPATELPRAESLEDTYLRVQPYWQQRIIPALAGGRNVLLVSHKNVLRGLVRLLEGWSEADVKRIKVRTCVPIVFTLDRTLAVTARHALRTEATETTRATAAMG